MTFLIILAIIIVAGAAWVFRVPLMAKVLGQSEERVRRTLGPGKRR